MKVDFGVDLIVENLRTVVRIFYLFNKNTVNISGEVVIENVKIVLSKVDTKKVVNIDNFYRVSANTTKRFFKEIIVPPTKVNTLKVKNFQL